MRRYLISILLFVIVACSDLGETNKSILSVKVTTTPTGISITNISSIVVYYAVFGANYAERANWARISRPENSIMPGSAVTVLYESIPRDEEEKEAIVYWWTNLDEEIQSARVRL